MKKKSLELKKLNLAKKTISNLNEVTGGTPPTYTPCSNGCITVDIKCPLSKVPTVCVPNTTTVISG